MNPKVHILTFHNALNYGAVLQCYALYKTISGFADVDVVDYRSDKIEERYKLFSKSKSLKFNLYRFITYNKILKKRKLFNSFIDKNIELTPKYDKASVYNGNWNKNDKFCVGSDQVWNTVLSQGDDTYMLDFAPNGSVKFSYAASVGFDIDEESAGYFTDKLADFTAVSVREKTLYESFVKYNIKCSRHVDPVFLLDKKAWEDVSSPCELDNQKFVLVYLLQKSDIMLEKAKKYAKSRNMPIYSVSMALKRDKDINYLDVCSPEHFIRLFLKADTVFTNSFHGISFSILFNKHFYYELQRNGIKTNSRLSDIIEMFGLENQNLDNYDAAGLSENIDYERVNSIIRSEADKSVDYLKKVICAQSGL